MNISSPTPPARFSKDNTFEYIAQVLAHSNFVHNFSALNDTVNTILVDPQQLAHDVWEYIQILQKENPADAHYLWKYWQVFRYDARFRLQVLQKITQEYQNHFNALVAQKYSSWQKAEK